MYIYVYMALFRFVTPLDVKVKKRVTAHLDFLLVLQKIKLLHKMINLKYCQ